MKTLDLQRWTWRGTINSDGARTSSPLWAQGFRDGRASDETDVVAVSTRKADGTSARRFLDRAGFTLIELLVVIAVIGVLAALVVGIIPAALDKSKRSNAKAHLRALEQAIHGYQVEKGFYPPDNQDLSFSQEHRDSHPPLVFELLGCNVTIDGMGTNYITPMGHPLTNSPSDLQLKKAFGVDGFANVTDSTKETTSRNFFPEIKPALIQSEQPSPLHPSHPGYYFIVPVKGTNSQNAVWNYRSSSPAHNKKSFDLWTTIQVGNRRHLISNWDQP